MTTNDTRDRGGIVGGALTVALLITLAAQNAVPPMATDMYSAAFPQITADLATNSTMLGFTLTTFFVGYASGQVLGGAISVVTILAYTAIAGMVGAGGLGSIAIQYGHNRGITSLMWVTVVFLIIFVQIVQWVFNWWSKRIDKRLK